MPCILWYLFQSQSRIVRAEHALDQGDLEAAIFLATDELEVRPDSDRAFVVAGLVYVAAKDYSSAQDHLGRVSANDPQLWVVAQRELSRIAMEYGRVSAAESHLRNAMRSAPEDPLTCDQLILLLSLEGRAWEARELAWQRLRSGVVTANYLSILSASQASLSSATTFSRECLSANAQDSLPRLALAHQAWRDDQFDEARQQVELVIQQYPDLVEAYALWYRVLAEADDSVGMAQANQNRPPRGDEHPEVWLARGIWAEKHGQLSAAVRCYGESIQRAPNLRAAHYHLSQVLTTMGKPDLARLYSEHSQKLTRLSLDMGLLPNTPTPDQVRPIVRQLEDLGRDWEAAAWCQRILLETGTLPQWAAATQWRLSGQLSAAALSSEFSHSLNLSEYPLPSDQEISPSTPLPARPSPVGRIAFVDDASRAGIEFRYINGELDGDAESLLQMNGGGVAVVDYDHDFIPDLFFTQGGALPPAPIDWKYRDQFFRNRGGDRGFTNITEHVGLNDSGYGQGVTAGDFDNDGFVDLYVGNIGSNRLHQNNGDGTFTDVTEASGTATGVWTSSSVIADFTQDGLPDVYVATYLGEEALTRVCNKKSNPRCSPLNFPAEPDRFYLNLGDGRFQDMSSQYGLAAAEGRGLGVVAADFDGSQRLSLFVANDMTANFLFVNQTQRPESLQFSEQAMPLGLAYDEEGRAKACMGVAADDVNNDGRLDLFVTNFYRQTNDMYMQQEDGTFRDRSRTANLAHSSFEQLGWGVQFIDADLDGHRDLIVTNGHVYDPLDSAVPYAMLPQFFRNQGDGTFAEIPGSELGEFFRHHWHGRALARLDWNCDGREDVCISHMNQPAALLSNRTESAGQWVGFRLVAVDSARDAIGATVRVSAANQTWVSQLTAGDGYQASNERRLVFGLGDCQSIDAVEVTWPSGTRQEFRSLHINREWVLVEHRAPLEVTHLGTETSP